MSQRKGIEKNISVRTSMAVTLIIISLLLMVISVWFRTHLVTAILGVVPILSFIYTIAKNNYEKHLSSTRTGISVNVCKNKAVITCTLKSLHPKRLMVDKAYLFVDVGVKEENAYNFKHILRHEYGEESCLVEKKMNSGSIRSYHDINPEGKGLFFELKHLSSATILYVDPNEEFSDDCVVELDDGVYRAIFVTTFKNADCNCAMKLFIVDKKKEQSENLTISAA